MNIIQVTESVDDLDQFRQKKGCHVAGGWLSHILLVDPAYLNSADNNSSSTKSVASLKRKFIVCTT
jgi:hypothetical protein